MKKTTLLAIVILLGIAASYRVEGFIHDMIWQQFRDSDQPANTLNVDVTKEEYKLILQKRRESQKCNCRIHVYGLSQMI